jgi:prepilin-type N-terminal cleavage/methylation domain-containing protein
MYRYVCAEKLIIGGSTIVWKIRYQKNNRGFTLTELIVTISIIGILSSLAVVGVRGMQFTVTTTNLGFT